MCSRCTSLVHRSASYDTPRYASHGCSSHKPTLGRTGAHWPSRSALPRCQLSPLHALFDEEARGLAAWKAEAAAAACPSSCVRAAATPAACNRLRSPWDGAGATGSCGPGAAEVFTLANICLLTGHTSICHLIAYGLEWSMDWSACIAPLGSAAAAGGTPTTSTRMGHLHGWSSDVRHYGTRPITHNHSGHIHRLVRGVGEARTWRTCCVQEPGIINPAQCVSPGDGAFGAAAAAALLRGCRRCSSRAAVEC